MSEAIAAGILTTAPPPVSVELAQRILRQRYELTGEVTSLPGERDRNFCLRAPDGRQFMARFVNGAEAPSEIDFQTAMLRHVAARDPQLPVPAVISDLDNNLQPQITLAGQRYTLRLVTWLGGTPQFARPSTPALMIQLGAALGGLYRALDDFSHPGAQRELLWDSTRPERLAGMLEALDDATRRSVEQVLAEHAAQVAPRRDQLPWRVIHNDLNPHNVLVDASGDRVSGLIDFGDALYAPRINDLATTLAYQLQDEVDPLRLARPCLAACQQAWPLSEEELTLLPELIATRLALTLTIACWRARRYPENSDYILRNVSHARQRLAQLQALPKEKLREELLNAALRQGERYVYER